MKHTVTLTPEQLSLIIGILSTKQEELLGDLNQGNLSDYAAELLNDAHDHVAATLLALQPME